MSDYLRDFEFFWNLIETEVNFAFARYADGEVMLMKGQQVGNGTQAYNIDKWSAPNTLTKVGIELCKTLIHTEANYYYAISRRYDNALDYQFLRCYIPQTSKRSTFANLWINANYLSMKKKLCKLKREVILICNENAEANNYPFKIKDINKFPNDCISFWEGNSEIYMTDLITKYGNLTNQLFFISCGPVSEIIIHKLYENNPNNTYIDVGSALDEFTHGKETRPYMNPTSIYSKLISKDFDE